MILVGSESNYVGLSCIYTLREARQIQSGLYLPTEIMYWLRFLDRQILRCRVLMAGQSTVSLPRFEGRAECASPFRCLTYTMPTVHYANLGELP